MIVLAIDEYEAIRLIDYEGLSQEECSDNMNVARTTAQQIYATARKKIATALVEGLPIRIEGGDYRICNGAESVLRAGRLPQTPWRTYAPYRTGGRNLIIAIPLDEAKQGVCVSFGRAPYYLFHNTDTGTTDTFQNPAAQASGGAGIQAAQFVTDHGSNALITVRLGQNASEVLLAAGVAIYKSTQVTAEDNLKLLKEGKLGKLESFHPGFHGSV